ncbi:DUF3187 family protein [Thioalkalivibrio sp. XN8]|uniref:DUF3187 family protein n=1 Tax=Thioalkalivibrio sp. XN8 TaxID=2712863 RepID=UPI0013ECC562|nr:DUF3187 family protein [Thioalkalivibrio sp. XN8]NGP54340.1 DUF3187 family protein [Thioalkalivibrio sp. XN8]
MTRRLYLLATILLCTADAAAQPALLDLSNQHPLVQVYSLPNPGLESLPAPGQWSWRADTRLSNHAIAEESAAGERIVLDGESYRSHLVLRYGLRPAMALSATIPLVAHSTGMLDSFIIDWHDLWGLSNRRRNAFENNRLDFSYSRDGIELLSLQERQRGLGDVRLDWDWELRAAGAERRGLALRAGLKLPTGSSSRLLGSGGTDIALQLLGSDHRTLERWGASLAWSVGTLWLGDSEVLDALREDLVVIGSAGLRWPLGSRLAVRAQLDVHSAFYDSELDVLGNGSVQLSTGFDWRCGERQWLELAMMQNLRTDTTPDFGLYLSWRAAP